MSSDRRIRLAQYSPPQQLSASPDVGRPGGYRRGGPGDHEAVVNPKDSFGLEVVGAGVETAVAARTLSGLGCHRAQGLLIAPPLSRDEI